MSTTIRFKRGTTSTVESYSSAVLGEPVYDLDTGRLYVERDDGTLFPVDLTQVEANIPSTTTINPVGSKHIDSNNNMAYFLVSNPDGGDAVWVQFASNTIQFQSKTINSTITIPENSYGITQGPVDLGDSALIELSENSDWVIN